ncbi:ATP-binding protein [Prevotella sp. AGR2160]|uniref:ATP-binding protein n=1 Tax=Prevotella sp. AGR2160 TaxID=1280674 RepID=UPI000407D8A3|nr:ATP-binding protein [Prevotella sp. AGR2160]
MKYPIGIQNFESLRQDGYVYVDKTALLYKLASEGRYYFLSRPRRFGKSLLISTLEAYFSGKKELFQGLAIEQLEKDWTAYPVLHMDLNSRNYLNEESLENELKKHLELWEDRYGDRYRDRAIEERFYHIVRLAYEKTGKRCVILVDEYDKPLLQTLSNSSLQDSYRATLKAFYSVLKTQDQYIKFALLTGVTKFGKVSVFSDLNNLIDLSMDERYQTICGITQEEILRYFPTSIHGLAQAYHISDEEALARLERDYDGYHFVEHGVGIYNPFSLLNTLSRQKFGRYWFETGTPSYLVEVMKQDNYPLPDLTQEQVTGDFLNSIDSMSKNPIPLIYQSGYLTIKDYDERFGFYTLGFPNKEVEEGFTDYLLPFYTNIQQGESAFYIGNFVKDLEKGRVDDFMRRMETMLSDTDYKIVGDSELYFQNAFYLIARMLGFYTEVERTTSNGRMDMTVKTKDYIYIFEFKLDGSADDALRQIDEKGYAKHFALDPRPLIKVGVNFSLKKRCVEEWKKD